MQAHPIQLIHLAFEEIHIVTRLDYEKTQDRFNFDNAELGERIEFFKLPEENAVQPYAIRLGFEFENSETKPAPYNIRLTAIGLFHHIDAAQAEKRDKQAIVIGLGMLYAAIREQVATLTSRAPHGQLFLPTVNFIDQENLDPVVLEPPANQ